MPSPSGSRTIWSASSLAEGLLLPESLPPASGRNRYCRRLLYRDPELGFTAVVMTWGPGQQTALHDHAGIWCVEGVIEGKMEVTRFELLEELESDLCRFAEREQARAPPPARPAP